ncbi:MAG: hypothetical protein RUMPE_00393 [Eubacteriales bacterium SKADARSKE-1]|nr:hypothetical protein [Eubacteriales bacterium SKADARSKE-1]
MEKRKLVNKYDIIFIGCITIITALFFAFNNTFGNKKVAVIEKDGVEINRIDLSKVENSYLINIDSKYPAVILVEKNKISFLEASCPDKICKKMGKISQPNQTAICLPAKITIRIDGKTNEIDGITG